MLYELTRLETKQKAVRARVDPTWPHFSANVVKIEYMSLMNFKFQ